MTSGPRAERPASAPPYYLGRPASLRITAARRGRAAHPKPAPGQRDSSA
jgi:hypothetical protein